MLIYVMMIMIIIIIIIIIIIVKNAVVSEDFIWNPLLQTRTVGKFVELTHQSLQMVSTVAWM